MQDLVNNWMQREKGWDDLENFQRLGGEAWLCDGLQTNIKTGINSDSIA